MQMQIAMACSSCLMAAGATATWKLKSPPPLKFKCYATQPQSQCSLVHNDDLQALLQILPSDLHHNLLNQPNRPQLLEVILDLGRFPEARYLGKHANHYLRNSELGNGERVGIC